MEFRNLGDSGLKVSVAGIGCNNFGWTIDYDQSEKVIRAALDSGINFFDTADCYGAGGSETNLGRALGAERQNVVIATKFGVPMGEGPLMGGASRRYVMQACEASLKRLGSDYIDVYIMHVPDADTPIAETLDARAWALVLGALLDEFQIGKDQLDTRIGGVAERHAQIDHDPFAVTAIEIGVHADLARPAKGQE